MSRVNIVGKNIRLLRIEKGLTQEELGKVVSLSSDTISLWELGKRKPDIDSVLLLAKFFDVTTDYLLGADI